MFTLLIDVWNRLSRSKHILEKKSFLTLVKADGTCTTSYPLSTTCCTIGSHSCDIQIELPSVSPEHARIILDENNDVCIYFRLKYFLSI